MNEHQRKREEAARATKQFLSALSAGQAAVRDRFGNVVKAGQKILLHFEMDPVLDVVSVAPNLAPNVPPGFLSVTVTATYTIPVHVSQPWSQAIVLAGPTGNGEAKDLTLPVGGEAAPAPDEPEGEPGSPIDPPALGPRLVEPDPRD